MYTDSVSILFHAESLGFLKHIREEEGTTFSRQVNDAIRFLASERYGYTSNDLIAMAKQWGYE